MVLPLEERIQLLFEQLVTHTEKVLEYLNKNDLETNFTYILQHSSGVWQYAKALERELRKKEEEGQEGNDNSKQ